MRHLVIGQRQKAPNFSAFHWSPHGCLITIGQHFVTTRVVHLPKRTETNLITESDQSRANHHYRSYARSAQDQAVRAVHSCKSWVFNIINKILFNDNKPSKSCAISQFICLFSFLYNFISFVLFVSGTVMNKIFVQ